MPPLAGEALGKGAITVQFDDFLGRDTRRLMQIINILRNDCLDLSRANHFGQSAMRPARLCTCIEIIHSEFSLPRINTGRLARKILGKMNRLVYKPWTIR